ncbi:DUF2812 domain-containing protein [Undibacterium sp. JH2W]|uniref:DUF2812 domain-containing protein n=1 Tax=Undibacterium sp. JH2W TaxID=3413037 RepID=UPI003BEFBC4D
MSAKVSEILVKKFKCFQSWEDEQEQQWLQKMASQGLHLKKRNVFGVYTFIQGEPAQIVYRLDFVPAMKWQIASVVEPDDSYHQMLIDAGWEHVLQASGWQYWRKSFKQLRHEGQAEIYSDAASKQMKYKRRMLGFFFWFCFLLVHLSLPQSSLHTLGDGKLAYAVVYGMAMPIAIYLAYSMTRIYLRIRQLR